MVKTQVKFYFLLVQGRNGDFLADERGKMDEERNTSYLVSSSQTLSHFTHFTSLKMGLPDNILRTQTFCTV